MKYQLPGGSKLVLELTGNNKQADITKKTPKGKSNVMRTEGQQLPKKPREPNRCPKPQTQWMLRYDI